MHTAENQPVAPVAEIEIRGHIGVEKAPLPMISGEPIPAEEVIPAGAIVLELDHLRSRGVRVVLVRMADADGGNLSASMAIYNALREFSRAGGTVVVHITGRAASTAVLLALAGDLVLMAPESRYLAHSMQAHGGAPELCAMAKAKANALQAEILGARTWSSPSVIEQVIAHEYDPASDLYRCVQIPPPQAIELGWADAVLDLEGARSVARGIASGLHIASPRRAYLAQRPEPGPFADLGSPLALQMTGSIQAKHINADALRTSNYAEDTNGNPTAGAKMDKDGTALKVAPGNLQIGNTVLSVLTSTTTMEAGAGWSLTINRVTRSFGVVGIHLNGTVQDQSSASWYAIGTIPVEFRPTHPTDNVSMIGRVLDSSTGSSYVANFNIHPDGTVTLFRYGNPLAMPFTIGNGDVVNLYGSFVRD